MSDYWYNKITIIVWDKNGGLIFEGSPAQFRDCFFSNATLDSIFKWAKENEYICQITN